MFSLSLPSISLCHPPELPEFPHHTIIELQVRLGQLGHQDAESAHQDHHEEQAHAHRQQRRPLDLFRNTLMEIGPKMPPLHPQLHIFICMCKTHICVDIEKIHIDTHKTARRYLLVHCLGVLEIYDAQPVYGLHRIAGWYREWSLNRPASRPHPHTHTYLAECKCIFIHEGLALVLSRGHWARSHVLNTWHNKGSHGCMKLQPLGVSVMIIHVMCTNA